jgi:hypothetical protein
MLKAKSFELKRCTVYRHRYHPSVEAISSMAGAEEFKGTNLIRRSPGRISNLSGP